MKYPFLVTIFLTATFIIFAQPDMPLDSSLKGSNDKWKVKIKHKFGVKYKPATVDFGPVKTIETSAEKTKRVSLRKNNGIFWKTSTVTTSRECSVTILYDQKDTISIDILSLITEESERITDLGKAVHIDNLPDGLSSSASWSEEMLIKIPDDTAAWHVEKTTTAPTINNELTTYTGILWSGADTFTIKSSDNFSDQKLKKILSATPAGGLVFYGKGKPVAALQYIPKNIAWLDTSVDFRKRKVLLAAITGFLSTSIHTPGQ